MADAPAGNALGQVAGTEMGNTGKLAGQKHHYIPVFYLKQWAGADGRICEFSKPRDVVKPRRKFPDATGYVRGLNTFSKLSPDAANFLESRFFMNADNGAYTVLCQLLKDNVEFSVDQKSAWSRFIMTLIHRNPEAIERVARKVHETLPTEFKTTLTGLNEDPSRFDELFAQLTDAHEEELCLLVLHKVMDSENIGRLLNRMAWGVIRITALDIPSLRPIAR